jgi:hypothetical protein
LWLTSNNTSNIFGNIVQVAGGLVFDSLGAITLKKLLKLDGAAFYG